MGIAIPVENPVYELFQARVTEYVEMMMKEHMSRLFFITDCIFYFESGLSYLYYSIFVENEYVTICRNSFIRFPLRLCQA